jgi:hypothetical protein
LTKSAVDFLQGTWEVDVFIFVFIASKPLEYLAT